MSSYQRNIFEIDFRKIKAFLAETTGNFHTDTYTGKSLEPGGSWDFDHIVSAKAFSGLKNVALLPKKVQSKILSSIPNIAVTERTINKSKGKYELVEWMNRKSSGRQITNAQHYGINEMDALLAYQKAINHLTSEIQLQIDLLKK